MSDKPNAANIPFGPYCYASVGRMDERGHMKTNGVCPYRERRSEGVFCAYLQTGDDEFGLLADQVKICGVNDGDPHPSTIVGGAA